MTANKPLVGTWHVAEFSLRVPSMQLVVAGQAIELDRKARDVLRVLLERNGHVVSKAELVAQVWPGRVLSDSAITSCVSRLRTALGEFAGIVTTVHGGGYYVDKGPVFTAALDVTKGNGGARDSTAVLDRRVIPGGFRHATPALGAAAFALMLTIAVGIWQSRSMTSGAANPSRLSGMSVAVLPLDLLSAKSESLEQFTSGLHDSVLTDLSQLGRPKQIQVLSRTSVLPWAEERQQADRRSLPQIGQALGVSHLVEGSVQFTGDRLRVITQLIDTRSDTHVWAQSYTVKAGDLLQAQDDLAKRIASDVANALAAKAARSMLANPTDTARSGPAALPDSEYGRLRRAILASQNARSLVDQRSALMRTKNLLRRLAAEYPASAEVHAHLSQVHSELYARAFDPSAQRLNAALSSARRALSLDADSVEGQIALGFHRLLGYSDGPGAAYAFERAIRLATQQRNTGAEIDLDSDTSELADIGSPLARAHAALAKAQVAQGQWDAARESLASAIQTTDDPLPYRVALAELLHALHACDAAAEVLAEATDSLPAAAAYTNSATRPEPVAGRDATTPPALAIAMVWHAADCRGDLSELQSLAAEPWAQGTILPVEAALRASDTAQAIVALTTLNHDWLPMPGAGARIPNELLRAVLITLQTAESEGAQNDNRALFRRSVQRLDVETRERPESAAEWLGLAIAYAGLGETAAANRTMRRGLSLVPASQHPGQRHQLLVLASIAHVLLGKPTDAVRTLQTIVGKPFGPNHRVVVAMPYWQRLHGNPGFDSMGIGYQE